MTTMTLPDLSDHMTAIFADTKPADLERGWLLSPDPSGYPFSGDQIAIERKAGR